MKYIRTKDGIRDITGFIEEKYYWQNPNYGLDYIGKEDIIAQSDTIEELCDRCVVIHKYREQPQDMSFYEAQYFIDIWTRKVKSNDPIIAIYGTIWTDRGLIYVAKMNNQGELELL